MPFALLKDYYECIGDLGKLLIILVKKEKKEKKKENTFQHIITSKEMK